MAGVQLSQGCRATTKRQFNFYYSVRRGSWYSFHRPWKDERLSWTWAYQWLWLLNLNFGQHPPNLTSNCVWLKCLLCNNSNINILTHVRLPWNDIHKPQDFCMISQLSRNQLFGARDSYTAAYTFFTSHCLATSSTNLIST